MVDKKDILKSAIIGFFVISIVGTLLHFTFELSGKNVIVGMFSAVNESVWEHLKMGIMPVFLWTFIEFIGHKYRWENLWTSLFVKIITITLTIVVIYYGYTAILSTHNVILDIVLFYVAILLGQITGYIISVSKRVNINVEEVSKLFVIFIFLLFMFFTFLPPRLELFKDEVTNTFGIFELN